MLTLAPLGLVVLEKYIYMQECYVGDVDVHVLNLIVIGPSFVISCCFAHTNSSFILYQYNINSLRLLHKAFH
jgi:hypothetical protein